MRGKAVTEKHGSERGRTSPPKTYRKLRCTAACAELRGSGLRPPTTMQASETAAGEAQTDSQAASGRDHAGLRKCSRGRHRLTGRLPRASHALHRQPRVLQRWQSRHRLTAATSSAPCPCSADALNSLFFGASSLSVPPPVGRDDLIPAVLPSVAVSESGDQNDGCDRLLQCYMSAKSSQ